MMYSIGRDCGDFGYDFNTEENAKKWRGLFIPALQQIQKNSHPTLIAKQDGLEYVESLILRLLGALISASPSNPSTVGSTSNSTILHNISDVEERIKRLFPTPLDRWTIKKAHETLATLKNHKKSKANSIFSASDRNPLRTPVDKFHQLLQKEILGHKTDIQVSQYILTALEYIATDILQLSGHYVRNIPTYTEITSQDIRVAMCADKVLMDMFYKDVDEVAFGPPPSAGFYYHQSFFDSDLTENGNVGRSYPESVKELINEERQFIRDLNLIIKVFRDPLTRLLPPSDLEKIFTNIDDIYDFSNHFLSSLEDAVEVADEENCPAVGACFEEFAEGQEFDVFEKCAKDVMSFSCREHLYRVLSQPDILSALPHTGNNGMLAAFRYVLPRLLPVPVYHCFSYFKAIENFKELTTSKEDRESFEQAEGLLSPLKKKLENITKGTKGEGYFLRLYGRTNRATALAEMSEKQRSIEGWEGKDIGQSCNEFILDGTLHKVSGLGIGHRSTRFTERRAFLFDGLIVLCKQNNKRSTMSVTAAVTGRDNSTSCCEWRLKERYLIRNIEIVDREDLCERTSSFYLLANPLTSVSSSLNSSSGHSSTINNCGGDNASLASFDQSNMIPLTSLSSIGNFSNVGLANNNNSDNQSICSMSISTSTTSGNIGSSGGNNNNSPVPNLRHAFEISSRNQSHIVLVAKTADEKDLWMSQLILLNTRSMLERTLDSRLMEEAKKHPLQLPHASCYRFAIEDLDTNIIFEDNKSNPNVPLIKGATLMKLIERLTYHKYGDPMLVRTFLTTYRSFCIPYELLRLLIERFEIPEPDFRSCMQAMHYANDELSSPTSIHPPVSNDSVMVVDSPANTAIGDNCDGPGSNNNTSPTSPTSPTQYGNMSINSSEFSSFFDEQDEQSQKDYREMLKRFRKEYAQPVQFRVMNVIRHWIDNHYYDFERDSQLLLTLNDFLVEKVAACRNMRKLRDHIQKVLERKAAEQTQENRDLVPNFYKTPPPLEWHLTHDINEFNLLTLHPVEIARQLTLLEFELYRAVKPSELVGTEGQTGIWTKKDKQKTSPNLLKIMRHNSNFTFYLEKCIIEADNFDERVAIMSRIIEIMMVFQDLNNFNGVLEVISALASASVHRLQHTMSMIERNSKLKKALDEAQELSADHFKKYHEKLRSINPPCVPFFGMYLTNIVHIEEGNPEYLSPPNIENLSLHESNLLSIENDNAANCKLINFSKKRKVAEITNEIQQYQNQPYCLQAEPSIRQFLENLDPLGTMDEKEFNDYLYNKSKEIEPRGSKQPNKAPRRWPLISLKTPGIKTQTSRSTRFAHIPSLPSIDPRISNFVSGGSSSSSHNSSNNNQQQNSHNNGSAPNSATGHSSSHDNLDTVSLGQQMSPSTPLTPPQFASFSSASILHHHNSFSSSSANDPVFAQVIIGGGGGNSAPGVSPSTPIHLSSPSSTQFFPNSMQHPPQSLPPPPPLPFQVSPPSHPFSSLNTDFHLKPPPLPPRTYRQKQSPRSRYQPPLPPFSSRDEDESSPTSPPPLPPRSSHTLPLSRSMSTQGYRDQAPPPLPPLPHPSSSHHHFSNHSPNQFIHHQRVNSDNILSCGSSSSAFNCTSNGPSSHNGSPIVRRNSSKEPLPPRRFSQGGPPLSPFPISPNSPSSSSTVVCQSPFSQHCPSSPPAVPVQTPPPMATVASSPISLTAVAAASGVVSPSSTASSPVPELPPKTYRLSNVCR